MKLTRLILLITESYKNNHYDYYKTAGVVDGIHSLASAILTVVHPSI